MPGSHVENIYFKSLCGADPRQDINQCSIITSKYLLNLNEPVTPFKVSTLRVSTFAVTILPPKHRDVRV